MEKYVNDLQSVVEKIIWNFLETNKELVLNRIIGGDGLILTAALNKNIYIEPAGTGKGYYKGAEIVTAASVVTDHALLANLDYALAGHTGFAPTSHAHPHNHDGVYLRLVGGDLMLGDFSMNGNSINGMAYSTDWNSLTNDQAIAKGNIANWMTKEQTPQNNWYFQYGLRLPQGTDAAKSATPVEGQAYWATDTDKLYIGKGSNLWAEVGTGSYLPLSAGSNSPLTGDLYINKTIPSYYLRSDDVTKGNLSWQSGVGMAVNSAVDDLILSVPARKKVKIQIG